MKLPSWVFFFVSACLACVSLALTVSDIGASPALDPVPPHPAPSAPKPEPTAEPAPPPPPPPPPDVPPQGPELPPGSSE